MNALFIARVRMLAVGCALAGLVIIGRLYFLQIMQGSAYSARADAQFIIPSSPLLDRNSIFMTDKAGTEITVASTKTGFSLAVNPTKIIDPEAAYAVVQPLVPVAHDDFIAKATKPNTQYQIVATHLDTALGKQLQQKNIPGIVLAQDRWRFYPGGSLAAQEIGFVAYNEDKVEGRYGLERYWEQTLSKPEGNLYGNFFVQLFGGVSDLLQGQPQTGSVVTSIEPAVQTELERTLVMYNQTWHPVLAGGIIMSPQNGEIYAMAVSPTFDINQFGQQDNPLIYANPMVQNVYEMGSIIKPLTMAAGLDSGAITASSTYNDQGCITVDTKPICNFDHKARGVIPMQEILSQSLNLGASYIATRMGPSIMSDYFLNHYKLGQETGIDLPAEQHGLLNNLTSNRTVEYDTASFGQGMAITPIETVRALATLANGGYLVSPHFATAVHYDSGITRSLSWAEKVPALKPETATAVTQMLTKVVDTALANGAIKLEHYSVAAKTGTAQIHNPADNGYYTDKFLHSFFGYFPSYNAQFIIFLFAYEPTGAPFASQTWAPPFHSLTQFLINYYTVPPDR
jgi:cell division protein FtsI (penicillin-binding protein 3)/stage V sporulation protein D (sporulation-specific penicillin-binding protein)